MLTSTPVAGQEPTAPGAAVTGGVAGETLTIGPAGRPPSPSAALPALTVIGNGLSGSTIGWPDTGPLHAEPINAALAAVTSNPSRRADNREPPRYDVFTR
ncbi:hypothetical protein ACIBF5_07555 [Micromonospora sp. NPDC050417]|uniref:hypothetical protein n=1 Tax=Micromonospora sp. NPDC050417 TaxID=3364280 RepID=UPI00378FD40D